MPHDLRFVAIPAVLMALVVCVPVEAQQDGLTPEVTALPQEFLDRGVGQECWAYWLAAEKRWDW